MATFKQMINGSAPLDQQPFQGILKSGNIHYSNNDMTAKITDYDDGAYLSTLDSRSGALKLAVKPNWEVRLRVVSANSGFFNGNILQDNFWERHDRILEASGGDDFYVDMLPFETIEFDVDRTAGNGIADFKLALQDQTFEHTGYWEPNDPFWITLESATYYGNHNNEEGGGEGEGEEVVKSGFELVYENTPSSNSPFSTFTISGDSSWVDSGSTLRLKDWDPQSAFLSRISGAVLLEVAQGHYVDLNIMNEKAAFFNSIGQSLALNERLLSQDFDGGDSDFTIRLYGGSILYADADGSATDLQSAFGAAFYITDGINAYQITDPANDDYEIKLNDWGIGDDPYLPLEYGECGDGEVWNEAQQLCVPQFITPLDDECPVGYVLDPETQQCVFINPSPTTNPTSTDPFDLIDGMETPFDEDDELVDRLVKSFTFGVNGAFRAIEAVIEGMMIALPAVIVIGSAVVLSRVLMKATEKGAAKIANVAGKSKDFLLDSNSLKIEGVPLE